MHLEQMEVQRTCRDCICACGTTQEGTRMFYFNCIPEFLHSFAVFIFRSLCSFQFVSLFLCFVFSVWPFTHSFKKCANNHCIPLPFPSSHIWWAVKGISAPHTVYLWLTVRSPCHCPTCSILCAVLVAQSVWLLVAHVTDWHRPICWLHDGPTERFTEARSVLRVLWT